MSVRVRGGGGGALFGNRMHRTLRSIALLPARSLARWLIHLRKRKPRRIRAPAAGPAATLHREGGREGGPGSRSVRYLGSTPARPTDRVLSEMRAPYRFWGGWISTDATTDAMAMPSEGGSGSDVLVWCEREAYNGIVFAVTAVRQVPYSAAGAGPSDPPSLSSTGSGCGTRRRRRCPCATAA